jgi:hypothetical protein
MNALVVLNLNDFMPQKVRESFRDAARRWACEYVEITKPLGSMHHFWQKSLIPLSGYADPFDRILQLDADMMIRSDCPSLFDAVPPGRFGAVSRVQDGNLNPQVVADYRRARQASAMGLVPYESPEQHLNCGLILYEPVAHRQLLAAWSQVGWDNGWKVFLLPEQFALSCLLHTMKVPVHWLPYTYNTVFAPRHRWAPPGKMTTYIYHFNAPRHGRFQHWVDQCEWRIAANDT